MSEYAIQVENLSKRYRIGVAEKRPESLFQAVTGWAKAPLRNFRELYSRTHFESNGHEPDDIIWALKDVSFDVKHGETVGIIGRNGAGKSTLLKILSRITEPTGGRAIINGRVASLLEVGTGFHQELTGRENVYLNGTILGMSKAEVDRKFDEIVDFSGVEKFIDTPVKFYSSGMKVRLAFAVAAHLEPEILIIDEVLAVGDAEFQKKCLGKMEDVAGEGRTVLFVSHQLDMIQALCNSCILLDQGAMRLAGKTENVIEEYVGTYHEVKNSASFRIDKHEDISMQVISGRILDHNGWERNRFDVFESIRLEIEYAVSRSIHGAIVNFALKRNGLLLFVSFDSDEDPGKLELRKPGIYKYVVELPCPLLKPGNYSISIGTGIANTSTLHYLDDVLMFDVELLSKPSTFLSYAEKRRGVIAVPLVWKTKNVEEVRQAIW